MLLPTASITMFGQAAGSSQNNTERYCVLILDTSGSMSGTPASVQKQAAIKFCEQLLAAKGENHIALVKLNSTSEKMCDFSSNLDTLKSYINNAPASGGTNINQALQVADTLMKKLIMNLQ